MIRSVFDYFIPPPVRTLVPDNFRAEVLVGTSLVTLLLLVPFLIFRTTWHGLFHTYTVILIWMMAVMVGAPWILRKSASVAGSGIFLTINAMAVGGAMCLVDGGLDSPTAFWLPIVPLFGLFFASARYGIFLACLLVLNVLMLLALHLNNRISPAELNEPETMVLAAGSMISVICILMVLAVTFLKWQNTAHLELVKAHRARNEFLSGMSHELRTPLNSIMGFSEVLSRGYAGELSEEQTEYVSYIRSSGSHLLALIDELLDLSRIDDGRVEFEPTCVKVMECLQASVRFVQIAADEKQIGIQLDVAEDCRTLTANLDEVKFRQIVVNLLVNAVKYCDPKEQIRISCACRQNSVQVSVVDSGPGVAELDQAHIFDRFYQARQPSGFREGSGLGLFISRNFAELHSGTLTLEDTETGSGSRFVLRIPMKS